MTWASVESVEPWAYYAKVALETLQAARGTFDSGAEVEAWIAQRTAGTGEDRAIGRTMHGVAA